jgi:hypothetical protein
VDFFISLSEFSRVVNFVSATEIIPFHHPVVFSIDE